MVFQPVLHCLHMLSRFCFKQTLYIPCEVHCSRGVDEPCDVTVASVVRMCDVIPGCRCLPPTCATTFPAATAAEQEPFGPCGVQIRC